MSTKKAEARRAVAERLARNGGKPTTAWKQIKCALTWPVGFHAYDAIFVRRDDKSYSFYEHCAVCGRARSWVSFGNNHQKPGSVVRDAEWEQVY